MTRDDPSLPATTGRAAQDSSGEDRQLAHAPPPDAVLVHSASNPPHVTDHFLLHDESLRDAQTGRWNAYQIADALGVSRQEFAGMVGTSERVIRDTPDDAELQARLAPYANILAMVGDYYGGDTGRVKTWLSQPQPRLGNRSPLTVLCSAGRPTAVEQWIAGLWLGDGE